MVTKFGQFKKLKWPFSSLQFCIFCVVENIQNRKFFGKNLLVKEFRTTMGGGLLGISKKIISIFKTWQKMVTKFGQFKKLKCPNFVNCHNFVTIFGRVSKMKKKFLISLAIPRPLRFGIHWPINFSKQIDDSVYFQTKKKCKTEEKRRV